MFYSDDQETIAVFAPNEELRKMLNDVLENIEITRTNKRKAFIRKYRRKLIRKEMRRRKIFGWLRKSQPFPSFKQCEEKLTKRYNEECLKTCYNIDFVFGMNPNTGYYTKEIAEKILKTMDDKGTPSTEKLMIPVSHWNKLKSWM